MKPLVTLCLVALPLLIGTSATAALRFFPDRTSFAVANPNLTLEDFETAVAPAGPFGNGLNISEPLDSTTNNRVFHPGDLVDGIRFSTTAEGGFDLVLYPPTVTFATFPSQMLGTPGSPYNLVIDFTAGNVFAVGMGVFSLPDLNAEVLVDIFGASGLLGHTRITSSARGGFFGVVSDGEAITRLVVNDTSIAWAVDNIAFGAAPSLFDHIACYEVAADKPSKAKDASKPEDETVTLVNPFEAGTQVHVGKLKLLCVPTRVVHDVDQRLPR